MHITDASGNIRTLTFAQSSAVTLVNDQPSPVVVSSRAFVALNDSAANAENVYAYECELADAPKTTGEAWAIGAALYWDADPGAFTTTSSGNTACGYAGSVQASGDTTGTVIFRTFP